MENTNQSNKKTFTGKKTYKKVDDKVKNGEGVRIAFEKTVKNLPDRLDKLWETEGGKKYLQHLMFSFIPMNRKEVYKIGLFSENDKYNGLPKICTLTNFAVADSNFTIDIPTKDFFEKRGKSVNKLMFSIPCVGSVNSNKILSTQALNALANWVTSKLEKEEIEDSMNENNESGEFTKLISSIMRNMDEKKNVDKTKKKHFDKNRVESPAKATYTLADKFDFTKING